MPLILKTLDYFYKATYFTKLDIIKAFNRISIAAGEEWKTAFKTYLGLFEYLVLFFELSNGPGTFQNYINDVLENDILYIFVTAYINNILGFSNTLQKHRKHVKTVLVRLQATGLQLDIEKC